jgi:hypothetical protein
LTVRAIDAELKGLPTEPPSTNEDLNAVHRLVGRKNFQMLAKSTLGRTSVRELAEITGLPKSTIHDRLARTKATLERHGLWPIVNGGCGPASSGLGHEAVEGGAIVVGSAHS